MTLFRRYTMNDFLYCKMEIFIRRLIRRSCGRRYKVWMHYDSCLSHREVTGCWWPLILIWVKKISSAQSWN